MEHPDLNLINSYVDGLLSPEKNEEFESHLKNCLDCYEVITWINILLEKASSVSRQIQPPRNLWMEIYHELRDIKIKEKNIVEEEAEVQSFGDLKGSGIKIETEEKAEKKETTPLQKIIIKKQGGFPIKKLSISFLIFIAVLIAVYLIFFRAASWEVTKLKGEIFIGNERVSSKEGLSKNELLKTNLNSNAVIKIPEIGKIEVEPNSILKRSGDYQFELVSGKIKAVKNNAYELLNVKVPSAEIKDFNLGGVYTFEVKTGGNSLLAVEDGWVMASNVNRESIIPEKHFCEIRKGVGPGIPYSFTASPEFIKALNIFAFNGDETAVPNILSLASKQDAVSLWHLFQKVDDEDRMNVYKSLSGFVSLPAGLKEEEVMKMNRNDLLEWLEKIDLEIH